jgi:hypothetical protein
MDDDALPMEVIDPETRALLGMFDVPAFVRRGQELEHAFRRLDLLLRRQRHDMLDMVRLRLRQWAAAADGPESEITVFAESIQPLWPLTAADPPVWANRNATDRKRKTIARDLLAAVERFNRRWSARIEALNLEGINLLIDRYNRYYVLEKECVIGSARLASRYFVPRPPLERGDLFADHPLLPVPLPRDARAWWL